jgi:hypothetical protein
MKNYRLFFVFAAVGLALFSCASEPEPVTPAPAAKPVPPPAPEPVLIEAEDPSIKITQEEYNRTFAEVEAVISELNDTIKAKNIRKWEGYLTPKFRSHVTSRAYLAELNETPLLKRNNITIKTLKDYFDTVVVPSRANVRLDDLKFTDANRVQAFMAINGENVLIYQLEKVGTDWIISVW